MAENTKKEFNYLFADNNSPMELQHLLKKAIVSKIISEISYSLSAPKDNESSGIL